MSTTNNAVNNQTGSSANSVFHSHIRAASGQWHNYNDQTDAHGYYSGVGNPEGVVAADIGSYYSDTGAGALYVKQTDTVNTGWVAVGGGTGQVVKTASQTLATTVTGAAIIPVDNTIPQITEGTQVLTMSYTALNAANILRVEMFGWGWATATNQTGALFIQGTANAFVAGFTCGGLAIGNFVSDFYISGDVVAGTTALQTFEFRMGSQNGNVVAVNGSNVGTHFFGAAGVSYMRITEYLP